MKSVRLATAALPKDANEHQETAALIWWISNRFERLVQSSSVDRNPERILASQAADPMEMAAVFMAMADNLGLRYRTFIVTNVPRFGWYPLIEVQDQDGDHLWDVYHARFAPDYDGSPLSIERSFAANKFVASPPNSVNPGADILTVFQQAPIQLEPTFETLGKLPLIGLRNNRAAVINMYFDFSLDPTPLSLGRSDQSSADISQGNIPPEKLYVPAMRYAGDVTAFGGTAALLHRYTLDGLIPNQSYAFDFGLVNGNAKSILVIPDGIMLESRKTDKRHTVLVFAASQTTATVSIGTFDNSAFEFDWLLWKKE